MNTGRKTRRYIQEHEIFRITIIIHYENRIFAMRNDDFHGEFANDIFYIRCKSVSEFVKN